MAENALNDLNFFNQFLTLIGYVETVNFDELSFVIKTRSEKRFTISLRSTTNFGAVQNLDGLERTRDRPNKIRSRFNFSNQIPAHELHELVIMQVREKLKSQHNTENPDNSLVDLAVKLHEHVFEDDLICVQGVWHVHHGKERFDATRVHLLYSNREYLHFEHTHWWITQLVVMADKWLDDLFGDRRTYQLDDFAGLYRTNLNILGLPTDDDIQESATLSRLIYGLSSAYLLSGDERYYLAAKSGVDYQREAFRTLSADGRYCFWDHARTRGRYRRANVLTSMNSDDRGTIPLYEQIYALAGLAQYYRITGDWQVLHDVRRTVRMMRELFLPRDTLDPGVILDHEGFYSHIDPVTFTPVDRALGDNRARKNWNSIGDHIPAYLINLVLALDPLPDLMQENACQGFREELEQFLQDCTKMLEQTSSLILTKFPEEGNPFVRERFLEDWKADEKWAWQQDRGIVGHNLKIAWNLTRIANYFQDKNKQDEAAKFFALSKDIGKTMGKLGIDQFRSGVYDAMERHPADPDFPVQFAWANTKDFWQQEQGILAYLIMSGYGEGDEAAEFLDQARELSAFWNLFFLDRERAGVFFRVSENGIPIIEGEYGNIGSHSKSGYHVFELAYLAHIYQRAYLPREHRQHTAFALHFRPDKNSHLTTLNALPDFVGQGVLELQKVVINGIERPLNEHAKRNFQIPLRPCDLGQEVIAFFWQTEEQHKNLINSAVIGGGPIIDLHLQ